MPKIHMLISLVIITAALGGCQSSSIYGSGPVSLSDSTERLYKNYLSKDSPQAFVITKDGRRGFYTYCNHGLNCLDDVHDAVSRCEDSIGEKCFVFAEYGEITWKNYQHTDVGQDESATFSVNVFGGNTIYSGYFVNPGSSETFTMNIGNGNYCQGSYKTGSSFIVQLNCENDSKRGDIREGHYKGEIQSLSWKDGSNIDLKAPGLMLLEMHIHPYNGKLQFPKRYKNDLKTKQPLSKISYIQRVFKKGSKVCVWNDLKSNGGTDYFYKDKSKFSGSADRVIGDNMKQGTWQISGNAINLNWHGGKKGKGRWYKVKKAGEKSFDLVTHDQSEIYQMRCK
jgi:hypothetical protein